MAEFRSGTGRLFCVSPARRIPFAAARHTAIPLSATAMLPETSSELPFLYTLNRVTMGTALSGIIFSTLLLSAYAYLACKRVSRRYLDRVSFRLLVYAVISILIFSILYFPVVRNRKQACALVSVFSLACVMFSACMFFSMALNLQLVLVYGVNGFTMEKYYIMGSFLLCAACFIPLYAARHVGYVDSAGICWPRGSNTPHQPPWIFATQSVWLLLMSLGEVISFLTILIYMLRQEFRFRSEMSVFTAPVSLRQAPIVKYRSTIMRIGLYPLLSCVLSITASILDLFAIAGRDVVTQAARRLPILVYTIRPLLYLPLAATDPGFLQAIRALRSTPPERAPKNRPASTLSQASVSTTSSFHTKNYPKRFSETNRALVHIETGGVNGAEDRLQVLCVDNVHPLAENGGQLEIHVAEEDESIVGQL
ncbi:hypothetical protein C8R43DRAFT_525463 [Mycena crocata]|nr:hypothetical protein C8R43DRAFT_525463 [Mycena crocata]